MDKVKDVLYHNPDAQELDLSNTGLEILDTQLVQEIAKLRNLRILRLNNNRLRQLPTDLSMLKKLEYLDISSNLTDDVQYVIGGLFSLPSLKHLQVSLPEADEEEIIVSLTSLASFNGTSFAYKLDAEITSETNTPITSPIRSYSPIHTPIQPTNTAIRINVLKEQSKKFKESKENLVMSGGIGESKSITIGDHFAKEKNSYESARYFFKNQNFLSSGKKFLQDDFDTFITPAINQLNGIMKNEKDTLKVESEVLNTKKQILETMLDELGVYFAETATQKQLAEVMVQIRNTMSVVLGRYYDITHTMALEYGKKFKKLQKDLEHADKEIGQLLEAAETLEKETAETEAAKKRLAENFESEKEKLVEEVVKLKTDLEKSKVRFKQYQVNRQKMSHFVANQSDHLAHEISINNSSLQPSNTTINTTNQPLNTTLQVNTNLIVPNLNSSTMNISQSQEHVKTLTLRQAKDTIEDIYISKTKFDQKCAENKLPRETMEQHLYTYLNQKYGLKNLILDWAAALIQAVKKYSAEDNDVCVFGKILKNEVDEEFRFVQKQLKETVCELLKVYLKGKYPLKVDAEINQMLAKKMSGFVNEEEWVDIIKYMYNKEDSVNVIIKTKEAIRIAAAKKDSNNVYSESNRITYTDFVKVLLNFQLGAHEKFLKKFVKVFKKIDSDKNGILNEVEFRQLLLSINGNRTDEEIDTILQAVDPFNHQSITFSECVRFLSSELVAMSKNLNISIQ